MIYPLPAVIVSCGDKKENYNALTVSWVGTVCTNPAMCYISVRPERHSYPIIKENKEFVINLTTASMARATDWCGVRSVYTLIHIPRPSGSDIIAMKKYYPGHGEEGLGWEW